VSSVQPANETNERTANVLVDSSSPFQTQLCGVHGRRRDFFQRGRLGDLSKIFLGAGKYGEIYFFPLETKKTTFLVKCSKSMRPFRPSGAHG